MKRDELIIELMKLPPSADVVVFDWRKSISTPDPDPDLGAYEPLVAMDYDENTILLSFDNADYNDAGENTTTTV